MRKILGESILKKSLSMISFLVEPAESLLKKVATACEYITAKNTFEGRHYRGETKKFSRGGRKAQLDYAVPLNTCMHVNKRTYEKDVGVLHMKKVRFQIGKRVYTHTPPSYDEIPCTCNAAMGPVKVTDLRVQQKEVGVHFYRDCAVNIAYGIYARHFSQRTQPSS